MPANHRELHWAQPVYGWLPCRRLDLSVIDIALVYFEIASQSETVLVETHTAEALRGFSRRSASASWRGVAAKRRMPRRDAPVALRSHTPPSDRLAPVVRRRHRAAIGAAARLRRRRPASAR
jgi:hypothetical protein